MNADFPAKVPRTLAKAAGTPRARQTIATTNEMRRLTSTESVNCRFSITDVYQRKEKPEGGKEI